MNRQIAFDIAVSGIIAQGGRSDSDGGTCAFRGERGRKCAIGFLIKDEDYRPEFETFGLTNVITATNIRLDLGFMLAMQELHDAAVTKTYLADPVACNRLYEDWCTASQEERDSIFLECFKKRAREFAKDWGLSAKVLDDKPLPKAITASLETELEPA
jgi:hypothetical protein